MAAIRKFLFETDFALIDRPRPDDAVEDIDDLEDGEAQPPVEEPPPPMFSEEDMEIARSQGFAEGKREGVREAAAAIEQQIAATVDRICEGLPDLFTAQTAALEELRHGGILVVRALARKVLPGLAAREALHEIDHLAETVLERLRSEPRVIFRVNDGLGDTVRERLADIAARKGCAGTIEVIGDGDIAAGDCRVEWSDGGAERKAAAVLDEIDQIIARNLGGTVDGLFAAAAPVTPDTDPSAVQDAAPAAALDEEIGPLGGKPDEH